MLLISKDHAFNNNDFDQTPRYGASQKKKVIME